MRAPLNNPDNDAFFDRELTPRELAGMRMKKDLADFIFNDLVEKERYLLDILGAITWIRL